MLQEYTIFFMAAQSSLTPGLSNFQGQWSEAALDNKGDKYDEYIFIQDTR